MNRKKPVLILFAVFLATTASAVGPATYDGNLQLDIENKEGPFQPGEKINADLTVANTDNRPIVDGYIVVNIVKGGDPYYPSQKSNKDNVFHQEKVKNVYLKAGNSGDFSYSYTLPEDLKSGTYRVEAYFKTNRTPVTGLPFIYSTPVHENFNVTGSGSYPSLEISRTETYLTGTEKAMGDWVRSSLKFNGTKWPSLTGPVGVFTTDSMENVNGRFYIQNHGSNSKSAQLKVKVCEWDDTACSNRVDTLTKSISVPASGTSTSIQVNNPQRPGAYAVKIKVSSNGETQSIYRNRIIRKGNTTRIRKLSVNKPYIQEDGKLSVGLVAGASADHYTDPSALGVKAKVTVETMEGKVILDKAKTITRLSNANVFEQLYFNSTVGQAVSEYRVSASLSADGKTFDSYSYVIDYSKFQSEMESLELKSYSFNGNSLKVNFCGKTDEGVPANGEVQTLLMNNGSISSQKSQVINNCESISYTNTSGNSYNLIANFGSQKEFNITRSVADNQQGDTRGIGGNLPTLPVIAGFLLLLVIASVLYFRGGNK